MKKIKISKNKKVLLAILSSTGAICLAGSGAVLGVFLNREVKEEESKKGKNEDPKNEKNRDNSNNEDFPKIVKSKINVNESTLKSKVSFSGINNKGQVDIEDTSADGYTIKLANESQNRLLSNGNTLAFNVIPNVAYALGTAPSSFELDVTGLKIPLNVNESTLKSKVSFSGINNKGQVDIEETSVDGYTIHLVNWGQNGSLANGTKLTFSVSVTTNGTYHLGTTPSSFELDVTGLKIPLNVNESTLKSKVSFSGINNKGQVDIEDTSANGYTIKLANESQNGLLANGTKLIFSVSVTANGTYDLGTTPSSFELDVTGLKIPLNVNESTLKSKVSFSGVNNKGQVDIEDTSANGYTIKLANESQNRLLSNGNTLSFNVIPNAAYDLDKTPSSFELDVTGLKIPLNVNESTLKSKVSFSGINNKGQVDIEDTSANGYTIKLANESQNGLLANGTKLIFSVSVTANGTYDLGTTPSSFELDVTGLKIPLNVNESTLKSKVSFSGVNNKGQVDIEDTSANGYTIKLANESQNGLLSNGNTLAFNVIPNAAYALGKTPSSFELDVTGLKIPLNVNESTLKSKVSFLRWNNKGQADIEDTSADGYTIKLTKGGKSGSLANGTKLTFSVSVTTNAAYVLGTTPPTFKLNVTGLRNFTVSDR